MSMDPILWAMKDAPIANVEEWAVLSAMAESADEDGCNAFQSTKTIAERMKLSKRTVQRRIDDMLERGLLRLGDQGYWKLMRIPAHLRPTNYDLQIPLSWYGSADRVNAYRADQGRGPLTYATRPALPPAPEKKRRVDAKPVEPQDATVTDLRVHASRPGSEDERGDYKSPPDSESPPDSLSPHDSQSGGGVTTSHGRGRQEVTQPSPITLPKNPPHPLSTADAADDEDFTLISQDAVPSHKLTFDDFWKVYPLKTGKIAARKAWDKAIRDGVDPSVIVNAAVTYAGEIPPGVERKRLKHPQGWITAGRYLDEVPVYPRATVTRVNSQYDDVATWGTVEEREAENARNAQKTPEEIEAEVAEAFQRATLPQPPQRRAAGGW